MTPFDQISVQYAEKIKTAIVQDGLSASVSLSSFDLRDTHLVNALREISVDLNEDLMIEGVPLTEEYKVSIAWETGRVLGMDHPGLFHESLRAASNEEYSELVEHISGLLKNQ